MTRSGRHNEESDKSRKDTRFPRDDCYEGTAARTRPLSFDEIMLRRKYKKLSEDVKVEPVEASTLPRENVGENGSNSSDPGRSMHKTLDGTEKCVQDESLKASSRKKRENTLNDDNAFKEKGREGYTIRRDRQDSTIKRKDITVKERKYLETAGNPIRRDKEDSTIKRKDRKDITMKDREYRESEDNSIRRDREDSTMKRKDREDINVKEREYRGTEIKLKDKLKKDSVSKDKGGTDNQIKGRRRNEHFSNVSGIKTEKRHSREFADEDKYSDKNRRKTEKDNSKRRYRDEDDEPNRGRMTVEKHEPGRRHDYEISKRKERKESSKSHFEESRVKRRRSRSREHDKDINRRSMSTSPREHRRTIYNRRDLGETTSQTLEERPERQLSDVDKGRISSNGSSGLYRRHGGSTSGLGGYSPRKRRSEAGFKTPTHNSPEKKNAGCDLPPTGTDSQLTSSGLPNLSSSNQTSSLVESDRVVPLALSTAKPLAEISPVLAGVSPVPISIKKSFADSVQLTQVTQSVRRLYIENVPVSATEKALKECLNDFLLSLDVNHIHGAHPCIRCTIQKEKGQAVVEFLTPEDAFAALSFDGSSFSGSVLNIRRPEYFDDVATGDPDKSVAAVDTLSDTVQDSPHKIFVGGIPKALSSKMVREIVSAYGPLIAYHFEVNNDQPYAFLEYKDKSVTLKACAGLSGMKLGGQVLTAVQSVPHASALETNNKTPFYGIPAHAKPLLKQPTRVLKLKSVFSADTLSLLPESEVEQHLEDIQLECSRFGAVKSVNVIKQSSSPIGSPDACRVTENVGSTGCYHNSEVSDKSGKSDKSEDVDHKAGVNLEECSEKNMEADICVIGECIDDDKSVGDHEEVKPPEKSLVDVDTACEEMAACESILKRSSPPSERSTLKECRDEMEVENKVKTKDTVGSEDEKSDVRVFERGSVIVEFRRSEASCMAAHGLHGRSFGEHVVAVEYVDEDLYNARFSK